MEGASRQLTEWTVDEVSKRIREKFNEEVAKKFEEQTIDGNALKLLAREGNTTQYAACGLTTVGDQMRLKEIASGLPLALSKHRKKPTITEMKSLTELNQRIYKAKRKAISCAALEKWPGNDLPVFKNDPAATKELDKLVSTLEETCTFEPAGFNKEGIKQHVLDVLNERRRRIRKGHDYTQPDKRTLKKLKVSSSSSDGDSDLGVHNDDGGDTDILSSTSNSTCDSLSETEEDLSLQGAKVIITVMFSAVKYSDVAKQQLVSAAKKFKLSCNFASKDSVAVALAKTFLKENFVKVDSANLRDINRDNVQKLKVY